MAKPSASKSDECRGRWSTLTTAGVAAVVSVAANYLVRSWASHRRARASRPGSNGAEVNDITNTSNGPNQVVSDKVRVAVGPATKYIISTSGRTASAERYRILLEDILGIDVAYIPISSPHDNGRIDPERFAWALRGLNAIGGAISRDIKGSIATFLDEVDPLAQAVGAVNTVVVQQPGSRLIGYNTDAAGFEAAIVDGIRGRHITHAVCYGYGGVTSVVVAVLRRLGIECQITGRRKDAAKERAAALGVSVFEPAKGNSNESQWQHRLFVNAAPVTDAPLENAAGFLQALSGCSVAFDHELKGTYLRKYCADNGVHLIPGTAMYHPQMEAQWELFLRGHIPASVEVGASLHDAEQRRLDQSQESGSVAK
eukprot:INCI3769.1.p1 GENE.INCI3769.1~~INCI3769.1.p1  ORF type:complete len:370 (-),score=57.12 INCI3769.1:163-1272(-)